MNATETYQAALRLKRRQAGYTQQQAADALGCAISTIQRWEGTIPSRAYTGQTAAEELYDAAIEANAIWEATEGRR